MSVINYFIVFLFLVTGVTNFFTEISPYIAGGIILGSGVGAVMSALYRPFRLFCYEKKKYFFVHDRYLFLLGVLLGFFVYFLQRPTLDADAHVYRLPLARLMNGSVWYPGIGGLCSLFGFANGDAVLASLFTSFGRRGLESMPNMVIYFLMISTIIAYLKRHGVRSIDVVLLVCVVSLCPDLFWQAYNMGSDLPAAYFCLLGFFSIEQRNYDEALFFFAATSMFKPLCLPVCVIIIIYILFKKRGYERQLICNFYVGLGVLILTLVSLRKFYAVGNPLFPVVAFCGADWGMPRCLQQAFVSGALKGYVAISYTFKGILFFCKDILFRPHFVQSSFSFLPLFLVVVPASIWQSCEERTFLVSQEGKLLVVICVCLMVLWFCSSPVFRFLIAPFAYIFLRMIIFVLNGNTFRYYKYVLRAAVACFVFLFCFNIVHHMYSDVYPFFFETDYRKRLPYDGSIFKVKTSAEGLQYVVSETTFCHDAIIPCMNSYSYEAEEPAIKRFFINNKKYKPLIPSQKKIY